MERFQEPMPRGQRVRGNKLRKLFRTSWNRLANAAENKLSPRNFTACVPCPGKKFPAAGNKLEKFRVMTVAVLGERSAKRFEECRTTNLTTRGTSAWKRYPQRKVSRESSPTRRREIVVDFIGQGVKGELSRTSRNAIFLASDFLTFQITPFHR